MAGSRRSSLRRRGALALTAAGVALLLAEVALRLVGFTYPNFRQPDSVRGWVLRPGAAAWSRSEGESFVRINAEGMRDVERSPEKPAGAWRLAVLGDSMVEALQVPLERTFTQLLERELASCPALAGRAIEVLNFGVSGYGTAQELLTLRHQVWRFSPDAVMLGFFSGNDVADNHRGLDGRQDRPYFELDAEGELRLDDAFRRSAAYRVRRASGWFYVLVNRSRVLQLFKSAAVARRRRDSDAAGAEAGLDRSRLDAQEAWTVTEALLRRLHREAATGGARFAVAALPTAEQVRPDAQERRRRQERLGMADFDGPVRRLLALGEREGFAVLALARPLRAQSERDGVFLHGFPNTVLGAGHLNASGHAAVAGALAPWVCERLANGG